RTHCGDGTKWNRTEHRKKILCSPWPWPRALRSPIRPSRAGDPEQSLTLLDGRFSRRERRPTETLPPVEDARPLTPPAAPPTLGEGLRCTRTGRSMLRRFLSLTLAFAATSAAVAE